MLFIIGTVFTISCVIGGYLMHHGQLSVLWQPSEFIIIVGASIGSFIVGNTGGLQKDVLKSLKYLFKSKPYAKSDFLDLLKLLYTIFKLMKTKGMLELESHLERPDESPIFNQYPSFIRSKYAKTFLTDYLRVMTMGVEDYYQMEELMDRDLEIHHHEKEAISTAVLTMGDAMPALGIVAAVLGVIITMGSVDQPPEILGKLIGAALVGTFLGVLLSYGFISPMGRRLAAWFEAEHHYLICIKVALLAHLKGNAPIVSVEFARTTIGAHEKPLFAELEETTSTAGESGK
jgi:chemotaxis protein MotA